MNRTAAIVAVGLVCMVVAGAAPPVDLEDIVQELQAKVQLLEAENRDLRLRVQRLQAALMNAGGPATTAAPAKLLLVMELEEVRRADPAASDVAAITWLLTEADGLDEAAESKRDGAEGDTRHPLAAEARRIERKAMNVRARAKKIQSRIYGQSYFWLLGWDGRRDVMLWTDGIDAAVIEQFVVGQFVGFAGDQVETALGHPFDADFVTYRTDDVQAAGAPRSFVHRRADRIPVWWAPTVVRQASPFPRLPSGVGTANR